MKRFLFAAAAAFAATGAVQAQERPPIMSVSHLAVYSEDPAASEAFYVGTLGAIKMASPEDPAAARYYFSPAQFVEVLPLPADETSVNRMDHAGFNTEDAEALRRYLAAKDVDVPAAVEQGEDGSFWFDVTDPEGNLLQFVQPPVSLPDIPVNPLTSHMIHVGFIVGDPDLQDSFYKDILGFRPYWKGGPDPHAAPEWISLQLPDGTDWLEYMAVGDPDGSIPADMSQRVAGIFNHFALGIPNAEEAYTHLWVHELLDGQEELPKIGADAKWQLNLYDPDGTRAEMMELKPVGEPCCSPFTAEHPEN